MNINLLYLSIKVMANIVDFVMVIIMNMIKCKVKYIGQEFGEKKYF